MKTLKISFLDALPSLIFAFFTKLSKAASAMFRQVKEDPRFAIMAFGARFICIREWVANSKEYISIESVESSILATLPLACPIDSPKQVADSIRLNGYHVGFRLRADIVADLLDFACKSPCYANRDFQVPFYIGSLDNIQDALAAPLLVGSYLDSHEACPGYQKIKEDPYILEIASHYLGRKAQYLRGEMAWGFSTSMTLEDKISTARVYHCDINDYKTVKFFFYLTDVDIGNGPHTYIQGSHQNRSWWHQVLGQRCANVPDNNLIQRYSTKKVKVITGPEGYGFAGDPYCLHKGAVPKFGRRLLLQLEYGIYAYRTWYF